MQSSYIKTTREKSRKFQSDDNEYRNKDREFEKKRQKYRDEQRRQKRENWSN